MRLRRSSEPTVFPRPSLSSAIPWAEPVCLYLAQKPIGASLSKMVLIAPVASPPTSAGASGLAALSASAQAPGFDRFLALQVLRVAYAKPARITPLQINGYADGLSSATQKEAFFKHSTSLGEISFAPAEFSRISMKTFIVWGKDDKFLEPPPRGDDLRTALPNAVLKLIDDCGHIPHEEMPIPTHDAIVDFLKRP
jgi:pimeloyl-ACP methyl ester carboxylesterase